MKFLFDFFPVVLFYITYNVGKNYTDEVNSIIIATAVLMVSTVIQISITWYKHRKIEKTHIIVLVLALVFGGATIYFRDAQFLIWKVSLANWLFATIILGSHFIGHTPVLQRMMQNTLELPEQIWNRASYLTIIFFVALGILNLIIADIVDFDTWVDFKLFGLLALNFLFFILLSLYLSRNIKEVKET